MRRASHGAQLAAERELANEGAVLELLRRHLAAGGQQPDRDREIEARTRLAQCAGARLTVSRFCGNSRPELSRAARTRSRDSRIARSGRPTSVNVGSPRRTSTSTVTSWAWTPSSVKVATAASTRRRLPRTDALGAQARQLRDAAWLTSGARSAAIIWTMRKALAAVLFAFTGGRLC